MEKNQNITLDFTAKNAMNNLQQEQELAVMPATLAKKLLKDYSLKLMKSTPEHIIISLVGELNEVKYKEGLSNRVDTAVEICANFIQERTLIDACSKEQWELFSTKVEITEPILNNL